MAQVYPFRGLRYSPENVSVEKVVTQPYDKISEEMRERYYTLDPHNIVRIILGKAAPGDSPESNVYTRAARLLADWRRAGVIQPLKAPAFVVYFQRFTIPGTSEERTRKGFIGLGKLEDYANKVVFPHERTLTGPKQDRLQLLRHTRTHFEQIFMLYEDPERRIDLVLDKVAEVPADIHVTDEYGVVHTLWIVDAPASLELIQREMRDKQLIIADGHHRYETALAYRDEMRTISKAGLDAPFERMPMTFFNMNSPGLTILPTHRVVSRLARFSSEDFLRRAGEFFDIRWIAETGTTQFRASLAEAGAEGVTIGVAVGGKGGLLALLRLKPSVDLSAVMADLSAMERVLDVVVLHRLLIEHSLGIAEDAIRRESHVSYVREFERAVHAVSEGSGQVAFLLNPTRIDQMRAMAYGGRVMPQKSTDFYPKVLSGLLLASLDV